MDRDHAGLKYDIGVGATEDAVELGIVGIKVIGLGDGLGIGLGDGLIISKGLGIDEGLVDGDHVGLNFDIGVGATEVAVGLGIVEVQVSVGRRTRHRVGRRTWHQ